MGEAPGNLWTGPVVSKGMKTRLIVIAAGLILFLAGCGGEGSLPAGSGSSPSPAETAEVSPTPTEEPGLAEMPDEQDGERAQIVVRRPTAGDRVASPLMIAGDADVFEATVSLRLVARQGEVLVDDFTTATCGSGCRGDYRTRVHFEVDEPTEAVLEVFESSAEDGSELHMVRIPLTLLP